MSHRSRRRRRPGRRPPDRLSPRFLSSPHRGFTGHGLGSSYRLLLPSLQGGEKRDFFNRVSGSLVAGFALGGAAVGYAWLGPLGAALGLGGGLMAGDSVAGRGRFFRLCRARHNRNYAHLRIMRSSGLYSAGVA